METIAEILQRDPLEWTTENVQQLIEMLRKSRQNFMAKVDKATLGPNARIRTTLPKLTKREADLPILDVDIVI